MNKEKTIKTLSAVLKELDMAPASLAKELGFGRAQIIYDVLNPNRENVGISKNLATKIVEHFPQFNQAFLLTGEGPMLKDDCNTSIKYNTVLVPILPISAEGGTLGDFADSVREQDCEQIKSPIDGADFAMSVRGDSMAPEYPSGSQIFIKKINEKSFIEWGKTYVLDTCNGSVIKKLEQPEDPSKYRCVPINPAYEPFDVPINDVYGVYRVLLCMSMK